MLLKDIWTSMKLSWNRMIRKPWLTLRDDFFRRVRFGMILRMNLMLSAKCLKISESRDECNRSHFVPPQTGRAMGSWSQDKHHSATTPQVEKKKEKRLFSRMLFADKVKRGFQKSRSGLEELWKGRPGETTNC